MNEIVNPREHARVSGAPQAARLHDRLLDEANGRPAPTTDLAGNACKIQPGKDQIPILVPGDTRGCHYTSPEVKPPEAKPAAKPTETKPVATKPAETKPGDSKPADSKPALPHYDTAALYHIGMQSAVHIKVGAIHGGRPDSATGSGVIIGKDGSKVYMATDNHVANPPLDGAKDKVTTRKIEMPDGKTYDAKVVLKDPANDRAVLEVDAGANAAAYKPAEFAEQPDKTGSGAVVGWPLNSKSAYASPTELEGTKSALEIFKRKQDLLPGENPDRQLIYMRGHTEEGDSGALHLDVHGRVIGLLEGGTTNRKYSYSNPVNRADVDSWMEEIKKKR